MGTEEIEAGKYEVVFEDPVKEDEKELMNSFANGELDFDKLGSMMGGYGGEKRNYTKAKITKKQKKIRAKMVKSSRKKNRR